MSLSHLPDLLSNAFDDLAHWLDRRSAARLPALLYGALFGKGRRTVTSWFRAAGITDDFRNAYVTVCAAGRRTDRTLAHLPFQGSGRAGAADGSGTNP